MGFFSSIAKPFKKAFDWVGDNVGDALGFFGDIAGGLMGMSSSNKATAANSAYNDANLALAQASLAFQQQYAKERLQWAKEDAEKAGFHPMVAAGLSPTSFSPVQASFTPAVAQDFDWVGKAGQNLSYAATKAKTNKQQAEMWNYTIASAQEQLKSYRLDNELKQLEINSMLARQSQMAGGPAAPDLNGGRSLIGGQNDSPFMDKPIIRDGWLLDEKGRKISIIPSEALKGRTEDVLGVEWLPFIGSAYRDAKARIIGHEVNGHWWHGLDKGYLPFPPKSKGKGNKNVKVSSYYGNSYRY